jgi:hypothetical protein
MDQEENSESRRALRALANAHIGACALALAYSGFAGGKEHFLAIASISVLLLSTAALTGGILGFLFGIPRTLQGESSAPQQGPQAPGPADNTVQALAQTSQNKALSSDYIANTNLEQISDWLTKILVGVGLTQISAIKHSAASVIEFVAPALGNITYAGPFAGSVMIFGLILGFLFGYLWTRLFLIGAFRQADRIGVLAKQIKTATEKAEVAERQVDELKRQSQLDAEALNLIDQHLNPRADSLRPSQQEIDNAVLSASKSVRTQIYYRARDLRSKTWSDPSSKPVMELTIPVFRALISADKERWYHASHGQLAYALKDKIQPDYAEAEKEFTTAIDIRDRLGEGEWSFYELYRAVCVIKQDTNFASNKPSDDHLKERVAADLTRAFRDDYAWNVACRDAVLSSWSKLNALHLGSLRDA